MRKVPCSFIDIDESENVKGLQVSDDLIQEASRIEDDPETILALIDLMFLGKERDIPS